jgi:alkylated DNA repair dioxygenase AlkB
MLIAIVTAPFLKDSLALSIGQAIQGVSSAEEGLKVGADFWLPSDPNLPAHYSQAIHHETRQRWASQLLEKVFAATSRHDVSLKLQDDRLSRVIQAAAFPHDSSADRPNKEGTWMLRALQSIHGIVARKVDLFDTKEDPVVGLSPETLQAIQLLVHRTCTLADEYSLDQACQLLWAVHGLYARLPELQKECSLKHIEQRVSKLPFEIVPLGLDWLEVLDDESPEDLCSDLIHSIPFSKDTIITRGGESVRERRGTAWIAQEGIGTLAYSGKLMTPKTIPPTVNKVMRCVEDTLGLADDFFDCALCNHYADATSACKFHTDPEHGSFWHRTTVVVAAGSDRKFAFKPIDTKWQDWDPLQIPSNNQNMATAIHLFSGDLVVMIDNCNDDFYHAVHAGDTDDDRVSLVLKRALDRNGKKGHGKQGHGRRYRRKINAATFNFASDKKRPRRGTGNQKNDRRRRP